MADGSKNLMIERGRKSVWDKPTLSATLSTYDQQRWMTAAWGSALALIGARRGGVAGGILAMFGGTLAVRAAMGHRDYQAARDCVDRAMNRGAWSADVVSQASDESFPASDSPSWTSTSGARARNKEGLREISMTYMDVEFPGDRREEVVRSGRNIGDAERWISLAAGAGLTIYGMSRVRRGGWLLAAIGGMLLERGATGHCRVYETFNINTAGTGDDTRRALGGSAGAHVDERIAINRPIEELYRFWRNLENLPRFMQHLESVERLTDTLSRWRAKGPAGTVVEWTAEIINEVPNQVIGWRSIEGSDVVSAGSVNFDLLSSGQTQVRVRLQYSPPGGKAGAAVAKLFGRDAATEIREDLQRFKQLVEAGEKV